MSENRTCPAALNIAGEHFACDWPTGEDGRHDGWAHANKDADAIWTDDPAAIHEAWASAEDDGSMSAREELARAIYDADGFHAADSWATETSIMRGNYEHKADAALAWLGEWLGSKAALKARDSLEAADGIDLGLTPYRCGNHWHLGHKHKTTFASWERATKRRALKRAKRGKK